MTDQSVRETTADGNAYEYLALLFSGSPVPAALVNSLVELVDYETVHILDVVLITRQQNGDVTVFEIDDLDDELQELFYDLDGEYDGLLSDTDTGLLAEDLAPGDTVVAIVWEDLRASRFREAIRAAGGQVLVHDRIPQAAVSRALAADS